MVRSFIAAVLAVLLIAAPSVGRSFADLDKSVYRLDLAIGEDEGYCTAWRVKQGTYITASHCTVEEIESWKIKGIPASVIGRDEPHDLAAMYVAPKLLDGPSLPLAKKDVKFGDAVVGYGYGLGIAMATWNHVTQPGVKIFGQEFMLFHTNFVPGMSGGPIFNDKFEVVSVVQAGGPPGTIIQDLGLGATQQALREFAKIYQ